MADIFRFTSLMGEGAPSVFFTLVNSDLTEGRGSTVVHSVHLTNDAAEKAAHGSDVQGTDGEVRECPVGVGSAGQALWGWHNVTKRRFGRLPSDAARAIGVGYGDQSLLPEFDEHEWEKYGALAKTAGRNPLAEKLAARRAETDLHPGEDNHTLFAVVTSDSRGGGQPFIVAIIDPHEDEEEAAVQFVSMRLDTPELVDHWIVPLYVGVAGGEKWGQRLALPGANRVDVTLATIGRHPEGTFFFVPGTTDSYRLTGGKLFTDDGYEADLLSLVKAGLRVRTEEDEKDIAYATMEYLLSKAPTRFE